MREKLYSELKKGTFLISSPEVEMGIYFRSVILLCEHTSAGSFGLVINKHVEIDLPDEFLNLDQLANPNIQLRAGGQLQPSQMMMLHSSDRLTEHSLELVPGLFLGGDAQFLQEALQDEHGPNIRLCFGYAGWSAGQLEEEFLSGLWYLAPASAEYVFDVPPEQIWQRILREMGGKYATLSMIPEDLSLN